MVNSGLEAEQDGLMWHAVGTYIKVLRIADVFIMAKRKADMGK